MYCGAPLEAPIPCPGCQRPTSPRARECVFCRTPIAKGPEPGSGAAANPDNPGALFLLATELQKLGKHAEALATFDRLAKLVPKEFFRSFDGAVYEVCRGLSSKALGRPEEARASFDKARVISPKYGVAWNNLADVLDDLGRPDEALKAYDTAVRCEPDNAAYWTDRGVVLRKLGRPELAMASYERALAADPRHAFAWNNLGNVLLQLGRPDDARAAFERCLALEPGNANARTQLEQLGRGPAVPAAGSPSEAALAIVQGISADAFAKVLAERVGFRADHTPASIAALDLLLDIIAPPGSENAGDPGFRMGVMMLFAEALRRCEGGRYIQLQKSTPQESLAVELVPGRFDVQPLFVSAARLSGKSRLYEQLEAARRIARLLRQGREPGTSGVVLPIGASPIGEPGEAAAWREHADALRKNDLEEEATLFERIAAALERAG